MIPKIIHFCWLSNDPYTGLVQRCVDSWKKNLPDYELRVWDRQLAPDIPWVREAYEAKKYAFAADYIRFYALCHHGGIYLDSDVEVLKSFDDFLHHQSFIGFDTVGDFEAAVIGAAPGVPWLKTCMDWYTDRHFAQEDGRLETSVTVPLLIRDVIHDQYGRLDKKEDIQSVGDRLTVYPSHYFSPKSLFTHRTDQTDDTVTIHHFDGNWVERTGFFRLKFFLQKITIMVFGKRVHRRIIEIVRKR